MAAAEEKEAKRLIICLTKDALIHHVIIITNRPQKANKLYWKLKMS